MIPQSPAEAGKLARREKLNEKLRTLSEWCLARAEGEHDVDTTLTMLDRKACEARAAVVTAGHDAFCKWTRDREGGPAVFRSA